MASRPLLHSYYGSSCSWRVRIALAYKGIEYDTKPVHLLEDGGRQNSDSYRELNPQCEVPTLEIDGQKLTQSLSIIEYLDETRGPPYLLPRDNPLKRQQVRAVSDIIASGIQPIQNLRVLQYVGSEKKAEWGHYWIHRGFQGLERYLKNTAGKYCVGDEITMADLVLAPQVRNANRFKVDMSEFPIISRINTALLELDEFKQTAPTKQLDCPPELRT